MPVRAAYAAATIIGFRSTEEQTQLCFGHRLPSHPFIIISVLPILEQHHRGATARDNRFTGYGFEINVCLVRRV